MKIKESLAIAVKEVFTEIFTEENTVESYIRKLEKHISEKTMIVHCVMSNVRALTRLKKRFEDWCKGGQGHGQLFKHLYNVREWNIEDRLPEEVKKALEEDIELKSGYGQSDIDIIFELWGKNTNQERTFNSTS